MSNGKVLFTFWDGGYGHLERVLSIAQFLKDKGFIIGAISSSNYLSLISKRPFFDEIYCIENKKSHIHTPPYPFPVYKHAYTHSQRLRGLEFDDIKFLKSTVQKEISAIKKFKPNLIINDYRDTIRISAESENIPIIGITNSNGNTNGYKLGWWVPIPKDLIFPDCLDSFNIVRDYFGLTPYSDEREIFEGDICIIPNSELLEPLKTKGEKDIHVGILNQIEPTIKTPKNIGKNALDAKKVVFWYVGEINNRPIVDFDSMLSKIVDRKDIFFIIAGPKERYPKISKKALSIENIYHTSFLQGGEYSWVLKNASIIINHGGSTITMGLANGIPGIAIPWTSEQTPGIWGSKLGACIHLPHSIRYLERRMAPDLGKGVEILGHWESDLTSESLEHSINTILSDDSYKEKSIEISKEMQLYGGLNQIHKIVHQFI
jgi:hypothetical protein